ncbi:HTH domain-containing protein [Salinibacterium sp. ZJ450]|uniref:DUF2637 domain-containing protein n=1 Tax=Salinibacterium sp. ZJ450 TaxID=2708338 RepID=UPI00141EF4DA|nr:HTH domain-containing protein [Salinibacterium sp. ZJ450]
MPKFDSPTLIATEAQRPIARISPTSGAFVKVTVAVTLISFAAAFLISGFAQIWVGEQIGLPGWARIAVPLAIDAPMLAFGLGAISHRARGESTRGSYVWLATFTGASIGANVWHSASLGTVEGWGILGAVVVSALIPVAVLGTSEQVLGILVAPPTSTDRELLRAKARVVDRVAMSGQAAGSKRPRKSPDEAHDEAQLIKAAKLAEPDLSGTELAKLFNVSRVTVSKALNSPA